jgi:hypothetical protein
MALGAAGSDRTTLVWLARADELEAVIRLSLGDVRSRPSWPAGCPPPPATWVKLASNDSRAARDYLQSPSLADLTPRRELVRQLLLAAAAVAPGCGSDRAR